MQAESAMTELSWITSRTGYEMTQLESNLQCRYFSMAVWVAHSV